MGLLFIEKAASRQRKSGKGSDPCGLFECPYCHKQFITILSHGKRDHSCGCVKRQRIAEARTTHGAARRGNHSALYTKWGSMKARCNDAGRKNYGGKGIKVCPEWADDFASFESWSLANGYQGGLEIDRKNADLGYSPGNCRWVTRTVNNRTTSRIKLDMRLASKIRECAPEGLKAKIAISNELGVSHSAVYRVLSNKSWQEGKER